MTFNETELPGVWLITPEAHGDRRGFFMRIFDEKELKEHGIDFSVVQANRSMSGTKGTVRGMHYQADPHGEGKIIQCVRGKVFDVAVDVRKDSPTYLKWFGTELSDENNNMFYIPTGFAHGFQTLSDDAELLYFMSSEYVPEAATGVRYNDPVIGIEWPMEPKELSERDQEWPLLEV